MQHVNTPLILSKMSCKCRHSVGLLFALLVVILVSLASEGMSIGFSSIYSHKIAETGLLTWNIYFILVTTRVRKKIKRERNEGGAH